VGQASYTPDAWSIITAEAARRGLDLRVAVKSAGPRSRLISLDDGLQDQPLGPAAAEGRKQVQAIVLLTVLLSAGSMLLALLAPGSPAELQVPEVVRVLVNFALIVAVCVKLVQGREWARWITAVLLGYASFNGLWTVFEVRDTIPRDALLVGSISIAFGSMALVLALSPGIRAYFEALAAAGRRDRGTQGLYPPS
jgi:hypothetical protein